VTDRSLTNSLANTTSSIVSEDVFDKKQPAGEQHSMWNVRDTLTFLLLFVGAVGLYSFGIGVQEYFRHTEADRTLIAWEMWRSGNYKVPQLLGAVILTKPPVYYWILSSSFTLFQSVSEVAARFPSVLIGGLFVALQYVLVWHATKDKIVALLSALFLGTSATFLILATVAEIDMTFGFFCTLSLYCVYFGINRGSQLWTGAAYLFAAIAFLVKGPPIIFFFAASSSLFFLWTLFCSPVSERGRLFWRHLWQNLSGLALFVALAGLWLASLTTEVSLEELVKQFDREVVDRVVATPRLDRGALFYVGKLLESLMPWSIFLILGIVVPAARYRKNFSKQFSPIVNRNWSFVLFNIIVLLTGLLMLSISASKSSRYMFPVFTFAVNLAVFGAVALRGSKTERNLFLFGKYFALLFAVAGLACAFFVELKGVSSLSLYFAMALLVASAVLLFKGASKQQRVLSIIALVCLMCSGRVAMAFVYAPHRNHQRSVQPIVEKLMQTLPADQPLYTVELFERWIVYYLQRNGRQVYRLTPAKAAAMLASGQTAYLLLSYDEEAWRFGQLKEGDPAAKIIVDISNGYDRVYVASTSAQAFPLLELSEEFPTTPTPPKPGYTELYPQDK